MTFPFRLAPLGEEHERSLFRCGEDALDRYFQTQATQDIRSGVANCFAPVETVSSSASRRNQAVAALPDRARRSDRAAGRGLGAALLADASTRTLKADAATFTVLVEAKNDQSVAFYEHFGFRILASRPRTLFLPLATAQKIFLQKDVR